MSTEATTEADNYFWVLSENRYIYMPTRSLIEKSAVVRQLGKEEATLVETTRVCSNLTWMPGQGSFIADKAIVDGEIFDFPGNNLFNMYKPPKPLSETAVPSKAKFWLELGDKLFGDHLPHILDCLASKVQRPEVKINHGLVLGSYDHGTGKDSFLWPVKRGIGFANWRSKGASAVLKNIENNFTPFLRATILQISEVHEMGDKRFTFYDSTKDWCAAPPETLTIADKNVKEYPILNAVLPIWTTNHLTDGLYIPPEDRRTYYVWSPVRSSDFTEAYWRDYWDKLKRLGYDEHVAAFLMKRDLSKFNPGAPPQKTAAWHEAVNANRNPDDAQLSDLLDAMAHDWICVTGELVERASAVTLEQLTRHPKCRQALRAALGKPRTATHRLGTARYGSFANPDRADGLWSINKRRQVVYVWSDLTAKEKMDAVLELIRFEELPNGAAVEPESAAEDFA
jgi:hypothetical protein